MRSGIMDQPSKALKRLEDLVSGMDIAAEMRGALRELRASMEEARADIGQLACAQADAIAHSVLLISEVEEARVNAERARLFAETARQQLDEQVRERTAELQAANLQLQANQAQMQAIMDYSPAVVVVKDREGRYLFINRRFEELFHVSRQRFLGKTDYDLFPREVADIFRASDQTVLDTGTSLEVEEIVPQDDGRHSYHALKFPLRDASGDAYAVCGVATDVTERKRMEQEQLKFAALVQNSGDFISLANLDGRLTFLNRAGCKLVGLNDDATALATMTIFDFVHPDAIEECRHNILPAFQATGQWHGEIRFRHFQNGSAIPMEMASFLVRDPQTGQPLCLATVSRDISERKQAERELLEERDFSRLLIDSLPGIVYYFDETGKFLRWNKNFEQVTGYSADEIARMSPDDFVDPRDKAQVRERIGNVFDVGAADSEVDLLTRAGQRIPYLFTGLQLVRNDRHFVIGVGLDIRARKEVEEALRASQARYERAVTGVNDGIWEWNPNTGEDYLSPRWKQLLGYEDHELPNVAESFFNQVHPADLLRIDEAIRAHFEERKPYEIELRLRCKNGAYRWFLGRGQATWDEQGRPVLMSGSISDITSRKESEEALRQLATELETRVQQRTAELEQNNARLRENEERIRLLLDCAGEAIYGIDLDGNCTICNPACVRLLGYNSPEHVLGRNMHALMHHTRPDGTPYPAQECRIYQSFRSGNEAEVDDEVFWRADGTSIPVEYRSYPLRRDGEIIGAVAWFTDITVRRRNEELLRERARLTALTGDIGIALTRQGELPSLLQEAAAALVQHLGAAFARIWTLNTVTNVLELRASAGLYTHLDGGHARVPVGKFKIGLIAQERKPHLTNQVIGDPRVGDQEWARREGMVAFAGYPLIVGDQVRGVMAMFSRQPLAADTLATLAIVADEIGLGIARMTTLESLRESEERFRQLAESIDEVFWIATPDHQQTLYISPTFERVWGFPCPDFKEQPFDWLGPIFPEDRERLLALIVASPDGSYDTEYRLHRPDGSMRWIHDRGFPVRDATGKVYRIAGIAEDITQRRSLEQSLQVAKEAAEAAARAKSEFLANMSHEIRTPLNGILGMTELALDTELTATQRDYLQNARASGEALLRVINDILDFSKIEAGKLEFLDEDFSLQATLGQVMKTLAVRAHQKGLEVSYHVGADAPDGLRGDAGRLSQVLVNLVGNAIKFTEHGEVAVDVAAEPGPEPRLLHFRIRDTGPGIRPDQQQRIFEAFSQVDASIARRHGGTGLGLTISARLVERMGGRLWVESEPGKGSTFHFTARLALAHAPDAGQILQPSVKLRGLPILVVDDNATNRRIVEAFLNRWQVRPTAVDGGATALAALEASHAAGEPYALVITDGHMPDVDGFTLARHVRRHADLARTPLLLLTSADRTDDIERCRELSIEGYLRKPVSPADLLEAISRVLNISFHGPRQEAVPAPPVVQRQRTLRILLAEDNPINQQVAIHMLAREGHSVVTAADGKEALARWEREPFDLVLMDVQMPDMDGFAATNVIREKERQTGRHIPIIALTAHAMKGDRERCLAGGMDAYLSKPIRADELRSSISLLTGAQQADQPVAPAVGDADAGPVWDEAAALADIQGDRALLGKMIECFLVQCRDILAEMRLSLDQADWARLDRAAHKLKGSIANFHARRAYEAAAKMEELARAPDRVGVDHAQALLDEALTRLQEELRQFAQGESS